MVATSTLIAWRRDLHQIPELDTQVEKTLAYVESVLESFGDVCTLYYPTPHALCAFFHCGAPSTIAIRAELDALPVEEQTGEPWASRHPGCMHACGHDAHMAMALGVAYDITHQLIHPKHNVVLVFEPAEETTGGAQDILHSQILEQLGCASILGIHLWPGIAAGSCATRANTLLAASCEVTISCIGKAAHIGRPEEGSDALGCICAIQQATTREVTKLAQHHAQMGLVGYGHMQAGQVRNQIAEHALLEGSLRTETQELRRQAQKGIERCAHSCADRYCCSVEVTFSEGYPALRCNSELVEQAGKLLDGELLDGKLQLLDEPLRITDDFSYYCECMPGLFLLLGTGDTPSLHTSTFTFDEALIAQGVNIYETLLTSTAPTQAQ